MHGPNKPLDPPPPYSKRFNKWWSTIAFWLRDVTWKLTGVARARLAWRRRLALTPTTCVLLGSEIPAM